jgi:tRNA A-37 threonylcarbamoyl transferase component Bud32
MPEAQIVLDRYRLVDRIAVGGSAEVWRAHDEQLDRAVAVKRLHPHLLPDELSRQRLGAEARAAAALSHPGIVGIYDVDTSGEWPALVMELVDGESLAARLARDGPLPEREAASIGTDLADALYHAHMRGVIHRDLKPGNVLIDRAGRARLADFGIARSLAESAERLTQTGSVMGTLRYMAPEQLTGGEIGPRTDLYGLGAVLHEALTDDPPFPAASPVGLVEAQRAGPPTVPAVDPGLAAVIRACLGYDASDRPIHAGAVAASLRAWLAGQPAAALALGAVDTSAATAVRQVVVTPEQRSRPRGRSLGWLPWLGGLVVALAVVAVLAFGGPSVATPNLGGSPTPTTAPTPSPTANLLPALLDEFAQACGAEAQAPDITGLSEEEAKQAFDDAMAACSNGKPGKGKGKGHGG